MMTLTEFLEKHKPGFKSEQVSFRPGMREWHKPAYHFLYQLSYRDRSFVGFFSMGPGSATVKFKGTQFEKTIPPKMSLSDLLTCLQSECQFGEMTLSEYLSEMGGNDDSWKACRQTRDSLIDLFGRGAYNDFLTIDLDS